MKKVLITAAALLSISTAYAADATPPVAPGPPKTMPVELSQTELQVALFALSNAGAACDNNLAAYCQIIGYRAPLIAKLQEAFQRTQVPPPAKK